MANFKEIMALCLQGASYSHIARTLGCSNRDISTVKSVITRDNITPESFKELPPGWFADRFADGRSRRKQGFDQPNFAALADKLKANKHLTRHKLWMDYIATDTNDGLVKYQYSQFCDGLRDYIQAHDLVEVIEHEPGQELYVDWAGDKIPVLDQATGQIGFKASLFIAVCPYSGLLFATASENEKMPAWINCHVQALNYLGKIPAIIADG